MNSVYDTDAILYYTDLEITLFVNL